MVSITSERQVPLAENVTPNEVTVTASDGAQTDLAISPAISGTQRLLVHAIYASVGNATSVNVPVRVGFAESALPARSLAGTAGILISHTDVSPGLGLYGIPGLGAPGAELRLTCGETTGGNLSIVYLYEIINVT